MLFSFKNMDCLAIEKFVLFFKFVIFSPFLSGFSFFFHIDKIEGVLFVVVLGGKKSLVRTVYKGLVEIEEQS